VVVMSEEGRVMASSLCCRAFRGRGRLDRRC
jgi:hypothetical protein